MAHELSCRDAGMDCDFMIRSENEEELVEFTKQHAQNVHDTEMSTSDIRGLLKEA